MAACVEIWESDPETLHYHGTATSRSAPRRRRRPRRRPRAPAADRLPVGAGARRGRRRRAHALALCRLARARARGVPARARGRVRLQPRVDARPRRPGARGGRRDPRGRRGHGVRPRRRGRGDRRRDQRRAHRGRAAGRGRRRARGSRRCGRMLDLPARAQVDGADEREMWTYWYLQEGEVAVAPDRFRTDDGAPSPVLHVDSDMPLHADDGRLLSEEPWGVYVKPDRDSVQGGAEPLTVGPSFEVDPYPTGTVAPDFPDRWCAALSHCLGRFEGVRDRYRQVRSGGVGAFSPDNFPIFDHMLPNVFVAADSNHGYKMIAVGREIARVLRRRALRCCIRSATSASRPATCTRSRTARTPGADGLARRRRRRGQRAFGRLAPGRARRRRGRARQGPRRRRRDRQRRRDRAQLLPRRGDRRARAPVGGDLRVGPERLRLPPGRLPRGGPRAPGRRPGGHPRAARAGGVRVGARGRRRALPRVPDVDAGRTGRRRSRRSCTSAAAAGPTRCRRCATSPSARAAPGAEIREGVEVVGFELGGAASRRSRRARAGWRARRWSSRRAVDRPRVEHARARAPRSTSPASRGPGVHWKAQEGEFALAGVGLGGAGAEAPVVHLDQGEPLAPIATGACWSRGVGHLLPHGPRRTDHRRRAAGRCSPILSSTPTGPTTPRTSAEPEFAEFFVSGPGRRPAAASAGAAASGGSTPGGGIVAHTPDNYPVCDWVSERLRHRRLGPRLQDAGHRRPGGRRRARRRRAAPRRLPPPALRPGATHAASKGPYPWT